MSQNSQYEIKFRPWLRHATREGGAMEMKTLLLYYVLLAQPPSEKKTRDLDLERTSGSDCIIELYCKWYIFLISLGPVEGWCGSYLLYITSPPPSSQDIFLIKVQRDSQRAPLWELLPFPAVNLKLAQSVGLHFNNILSWLHQLILVNLLC